jgi:hypothetical protein
MIFDKCIEMKKLYCKWFTRLGPERPCVFSPKGFDTIAEGATPGKECTHPFLSPKGAKENSGVVSPLWGLKAVESGFPVVSPPAII